MLMQMIPSAEAIGQGDCEASSTIGARTFVTCASFTHAATLSRASGSGSGRLENEAREISCKMNDVLTRAACDFEDDARHWQDIAKNIENEIAITYCRRRVLAVIDHRPRTFNLALAPLAPRASNRNHEKPLQRKRVA